MMDFFCPNCQKITQETPTGKIETKFKQVFYKAKCSVCQIDLTTKETQTMSSEIQVSSQDVSADQVLKEFAATAQ